MKIFYRLLSLFFQVRQRVRYPIYYTNSGTPSRGFYENPATLVMFNKDPQVSLSNEVQF